MFLINSAFVGEIFLYLSKFTVKQQLKKVIPIKLSMYAITDVANQSISGPLCCIAA
jgi:hypothetical protein